MAGRTPDEIWEQSVEEGERRLTRTAAGHLATGAVGGVDVMLGVLALFSVSGAVSVIAPHEVAHVAGSLVFGIGFVLLVVGRSELFTENFLVPISAALANRKGWGAIARLWALTLAANLAAILFLAWLITRAGLVPPETLDAAGTGADTFTERGVVAAFLSAVLAGTAMTLLTWLVHATEDGAARVLIALAIGFLLAAPSLNHAVVSFGEITFGMLASTADHANLGRLLENFAIAAAGNLAGGLGFVTLSRLVQARGEPG